MPDDVSVNLVQAPPRSRQEASNTPDIAEASTQTAPELSIVIACYMEEGHLEDSIQQLTATLEQIGKSYELIFIEDKSTDETADVIKRLVDGHANRRAVYREKNLGRGGAVTEGFLLAKGHIVGFLDIDLEVHCRFLPAVLAAIEAGADGATAYRHYAVGWRPTALIRHFLSSGYRWLFARIFDMPFRDPEAGFKFFVRKKVVDVAKRTKDVGWFWDSEIMILSHQAGLKLVEVPCRFERRTDKASTVRVCRDVCAYLIAIWKFRKRQKAERKTQR
ncbi:MAG: glycosyltransferase involved in cell wall biosynthesis [Planctomycetota bacterium]|jgi:glycosyltransferase involved in cell wall biosynthesis